MQPKLYVYYNNDEGKYRCSSIRKKHELTNIAWDQASWPVLLHVSFNPPLPSLILETLRDQVKGIYCTHAFCAADFDDSWGIDQSKGITIEDNIFCYPVTSIDGRTTDFDYENLPKISSPHITPILSLGPKMFF